MNTSPHPTPLTRRSVTRGLAWAAPAVAVTTAAPATAGSPGLCDVSAAWSDYLVMRGFEIDPATGTWRLYEFNSGPYSREASVQVVFLDGAEAMGFVQVEPPADPEGNTEGVIVVETERTDETAYQIQTLIYRWSGGSNPEASGSTEATLDPETCVVTEGSDLIIRE